MTKYVEIFQGGRRMAMHERSTLLEAALADGIGCRSGRWGSCKSRLVSGELDLLDHSRFALSVKEKAPFHPRRRLNYRVTSIEDATHDIKRTQLVIDGADQFSFIAGQYARLTFPGAPIRDYSMASEPGELELEKQRRHKPQNLNNLSLKGENDEYR